MQLFVDDSHTGKALAFVAAALSPAVPVHAGALLLKSDTLTLEQPSAIAKALVSHKPALAGTTPLQQAEVTQWLLACCDSVDPTAFASLVEKELHVRSYLAGQSFTLADVMALYGITRLIEGGASLGPATTRWLRQVAAEQASFGALPNGFPAVSPAPALRLFSTYEAPAPSASGHAAGTDAAAPATLSKSAQKKAAKKGEGAVAAAPAPAAAAAAAPAVEAEEDPVSVCDFRVGLITKAWVHPAADKLYCEEIDVGDATGPRQIASGLREHFTLEQMQGRRVVVVANLKPRPLAGFVSNGMVLCATSAEGKVEFVEPPASTPVGERVVFPGHEAPAADPKKMDKKKIFDKVAPLLRCVDLVAAWNGVPFTTSGGPCTVAAAAKDGLIK